MMTCIRLSDWWSLTCSIEDCTPASAPLLKEKKNEYDLNTSETDK